MTRWHHLTAEKRATLSALFAVNRRLAQAYLLREQLEQLWAYTYAGAARRFLTTWLRALRWQRLPAFAQLATLLVTHLDGLLAYCHEKVPFGVVEAINGNIRAVLRGAVGIGITSTCSSRSSSTSSQDVRSGLPDYPVVARFLGRAVFQSLP